MDNQVIDHRREANVAVIAPDPTTGTHPSGSDMYRFDDKVRDRRRRDLSRTARWFLLSVASRSRIYARSVRRTTSEEHSIAAALADEAGLRPQLPTLLPSGYQLDRAAAFASGGGVEFSFRSADGGRFFRLTQRAWFVPLAEELRVTNLPHTRIPFSRNDIHVIHGECYEEPIDDGFWHSTRWAFAWQHGPLITQIRCVRDQAPTATTLLRCLQEPYAPPFTGHLSQTERTQK